MTTISFDKLTLVAKKEGERTDYLFTLQADGKEAFLTSCIHGDRNGGLYIEGTTKKIKVDDLRDLVAQFFGVTIPAGATLYITPCHPGSIWRHRGPGLVKRGILVVGDWFRTTGFSCSRDTEAGTWTLNCRAK